MAQNQMINKLVKKLQEKSIDFDDVPEEYRSHPKIAMAERELGIRKTISKGYDIIRNTFFVNELIIRKNFFGREYEAEYTSNFGNFATYFEFLGGDIYENACYYKYEFSQAERKKYSLDLGKMNFSSLIHFTINEFPVGFSKDERQQYRLKEKRKKALVRKVEALKSCIDYNEFKNKLELLTTEFADVPLDFFLSTFIFPDKNKTFDIVMEYVNHVQPLVLAKKMCLIYNPQEVFSHFDALLYASDTVKKYKKQLRQFIDALENEQIQLKERSYFDEQTHFFVHLQVGVDNSDEKVVEFKRYFSTFDELMEFRDNNFSYCNLTKAIMPNFDFSKYKIGDRAYLPIQYQTNLKYSINKVYHRGSDKFIVNQSWKDQNGVIIRRRQHTFDYFFDFVYFLKGDLRDADLLFCDGLANVQDFTGLKLKNVRAKSEILDKLGMRYQVEPIAHAEGFPCIQKNEEETEEALVAEREEDFEDMPKGQKIYYISDLHLLHRLNNAQCKSAEDINYTIQKIIDNILVHVNRWTKNIILIGGDTSSDFPIFSIFVQLLRSTIDIKCPGTNVIFTLGNHELWPFSQCSFEEIVEKYHSIISENGMFLLQNNIYYSDDCNNMKEIKNDELNSLSVKEIRSRLNKARVILFGGLAFAGYNSEFNANQFIYRDTINQKQEVEETKKFEMLYHKVCADLSDKRVIVFTHMPQKDWRTEAQPQKNFIYVSGHTHRNYFYDDGEYRIYADNQVGYKSNNTHLKYFYVDDEYDIFSDYENGIYEISREEYNDFYHGKNIQITFNREFHKLFMLKKKGYYMFILQYPNGKLSILNGGALKGLEQRDVKYYFDRMDEVISYIKTKSPFDEYTTYQKQISEAIKAIGGDGTIHGSIVDIDFFNHIYVNPLDLTITSYYARDIVRKVIFPDTLTLLQRNCPDLYKNYLKQIENGSHSALMLQEKKKGMVPTPELYLDTDIYWASRQIKKMQKLSSNILSIWIEPLTNILSVWIEPLTKKLHGKRK